MILLSRVAERLYWLARYLERAQATARLTKSFTHLIMDLPIGQSPEWDVLIETFDAQEAFNQRFNANSETNVMRYLLALNDSTNSIPFSISCARENVRTTRGVLSDDVWEHVNELHLYVQENASQSVARRNRYEFLEEIIARTQMIFSAFQHSLNRDHVHRFITMGRVIERADMATRILDTGAKAIHRLGKKALAVESLLWGNVLESQLALSAYRRSYGPVIDRDTTATFLLQSLKFPNSVAFGLNDMIELLAPLPKAQPALRTVRAVNKELDRFKIASAEVSELHEFIDTLQLRLMEIDAIIQHTWFNMSPE
jgi:uncharacterized alpha-E superfamily protein